MNEGMPNGDADEIVAEVTPAYSQEQQDKFENVRESNVRYYTREANKINAETTSLWDRMRGKNQLTGVDLMHEEALAVEEERVVRQAEMDSAEIDKIRKELLSRGFGGYKDAGDNSVMAGAIVIEKNAKEDEEAIRRKQELEKNKKRGGVSATDAAITALIVNDII